MEYEVAVVGAGPSGSLCAASCANKMDTLLLGGYDERMRCAGLISLPGLKEIGCDFKDIAINRVRGAKIISPGEVTVEVDGKTERAWVVDRVELDKRIYEKAQDAGAHTDPGWCESIKNGGLICAGGRSFTSRKVVLACGTNYSLQHKLGFDVPKRFLLGAQYEVKVECDPDFVELHFNVPGFFTWIIPLGDGRARVGLATYAQPKKHLNLFLNKLKRGARLTSEKVYSENYGVIPLFDPNLRIQYGDVCLVGDAAAQVKATSGGGVVYGCRAAQHASKPDYEEIFKSNFSGELRLHLMIHDFLNRLSDNRMDEFFRLINSHKHVLECEGDMDSAEKTLYALIKKPSFLMGFLAKSPKLFLDFFSGGF
ncbi:MAG: geranylgeranyl reductase family protein [Candidatus Altiarchaeales archaeon]|nr:geranylgeranyl reductase family protein [Candidatus Altiarchaeales archaeon]